MQYQFEVADNFHYLCSNGNLTRILNIYPQQNRIVAQQYCPTLYIFLDNLYNCLKALNYWLDKFLIWFFWVKYIVWFSLRYLSCSEKSHRCQGNCGFKPASVVFLQPLKQAGFTLIEKLR